MTAHSPIGQRLAFALESRLRRRRGRLHRLELALEHSVAAGTGWTTGWRVRARVEGHASAGAAQATPTASLRTIDHGELPGGRALDQLWRWALDTSLLHRLPGPTIVERVVFCDAAPAATVEVIRHRVLRSAAALDRLPSLLQVKLGRRQEAPAEGTAPAPAAVSTPIVRLVAFFPPREGTSGETQVVVWEAARRPELVALLRDCVRRFDPRIAGAFPSLSEQP